MHPLAEAQEMMESGAISLSDEERKTLRRTCAFPGDRSAEQDPRFYPRRPVIDVKQWRLDHAFKLSGLENAERTS